MYQLVKGAGDAVEADCLKPYLAHESCVLDGGGRAVRGEAMKEGKRGRRVDGHGCGRL